ncbi:MAG: type pilus assembly protein PilC [Patescibacteria group bacterium]|nr:type pilus assembly protein PilC [Patescibacteria group bacterium]
MPVYQYIAVSQDGTKTTKGTVEAIDEAGVMALLTKQHLRPLSVTLEKKSTSRMKSLFGSSKVKSDDLVIFTRQLSAMVGAGVPLIRSLNSLEQHSESAGLKAVLVEVIKDIEGGATFGDALAKHPKTFNDVYINMVRAGETAGILDDILKRLAIQQEKNASMRKKIKSAMTYPMVLLVITVLAFFGLMLFVIPQIGKIVKGLGGPGAQLPPLTEAMLGISSFILSWWFVIIPLLVGGVYMVLRYIRTPEGRKNFHRFLLHVPAINTIIKKVVVARFARTFSALSGAGVSILETMTVTAHALGNTVYEQSLLDAMDEVKNGRQLSQIMEESGLYPSIVSQMLAVGEETGQTDTVLIKVAEFYEEEVDVAIAGISSIIEPVMIVLMGGAVGLIAASVMGPIANLSNQIKS